MACFKDFFLLLAFFKATTLLAAIATSRASREVPASSRITWFESCKIGQFFPLAAFPFVNDIFTVICENVPIELFPTAESLVTAFVN
jgi:hypothetical protein